MSVSHMYCINNIARECFARECFVAANRLQPLYYITNLGPTAPDFLYGVEKTAAKSFRAGYNNDLARSKYIASNSGTPVHFGIFLKLPNLCRLEFKKVLSYS